METYITKKEFVHELFRCIPKEKDKEDSFYMEYALQEKLITDYDFNHAENYMEKREAARIIHQVLITTLHEKDEMSWQVARNLKDIYECHTCVIHIAQVYAKGIMNATKENRTFGIHEKITYEEMRDMLAKTMDQSLRRKPQKEIQSNIRIINQQELEEILVNDHRAMLVNVRLQEEYEKSHIEFSVNIPLEKIYKNPYAVCENRSTQIIFYCNKGYQSTLAAALLIDAGYEKVMVYKNNG